jgi:hypothetical protein
MSESHAAAARLRRRIALDARIIVALLQGRDTPEAGIALPFPE